MNQISQALQGINIFLIGMMGVGKTTVGQQLAQKLGYRFFDSDVLLEKVALKTINEIFATEGEAYFRDLETQILAELTTCTKSVIATGGGIVIKQKNWSYLHQGLTIWLDAPISLLIQRLAEDNTRPLLQQTDLADKLASLMEKRYSRYAQADLHINIISDEQTPEVIVEEILTQIPTILK